MAVLINGQESIKNTTIENGSFYGPLLGSYEFLNESVTFQTAGAYQAGTLLYKPLTGGQDWQLATAAEVLPTNTFAFLGLNCTAETDADSLPLDVLVAGKVYKDSIVFLDQTPLGEAATLLLRGYSLLPVNRTRNTY